MSNFLNEVLGPERKQRTQRDYQRTFIYFLDRDRVK